MSLKEESVAGLETEHRSSGEGGLPSPPVVVAVGLPRNG